MAAFCPECGAAITRGARFCPGCGTRLDTAAAPSREVRKTVTVLFADVTGSTALGEQLDPEALRALMTRYFARMRQVIESHGGTVEKFIGDAVMAVFGIPAVHEDDALRAVRAAWEIRDALGAMNRELEGERGIAIRFRTGVNTGEVVAGDPDSGTTLVTGDTVNTAARLEQAAPPGEILMGKLTYSLVRDAVDAQPVDPVAAKGKAEPLEAYRLVAVHAGAEGRTRHLDAPMVGRERELATLVAAWRTAVDERTPHLVTLVAPAGVGKSRLVREVTAHVRADGGRVLVGRCLSYGEGITYWPVRELVHAAAGITEADDQAGARRKVDALVTDANVAARVASAIGLSAEAAPQEELFWAVRRLVEHLADLQPTIVVLEDLHWAEDTLLDLVDYVVGLAAGVPLLLLATARPDLVERRPSFGIGRDAATVLRLEPLPPDAADALLDALPGGAAVPPPLRARILEAAEGNPLYVEEFVAMLRDEGHLRADPATGGWRAAEGADDLPVPVSIQALLAARLEGLPEPERTVAQRASVIGRSFEVAALAELDADSKPDLGRRLLALVRKELLRPDRAELSVGDAFRFRHVLIRDAAYEALPKSERAALHERFADWLEAAAGDRIMELQEILAFHLEQAVRYRRELGATDQDVASLALRAVAHFEAAGRRANERGDVAAAMPLLAAAWELATADERRRVAYPYALSLQDAGRVPDALAVADAMAHIPPSPDERELLRLRLFVIDLGQSVIPDWNVTMARAQLEALRPVFELADPVTRAIAASSEGDYLEIDGDLDGGRALRAEALALASVEPRSREYVWLMNDRLHLTIFDDSPVADAIELCHAVLDADVPQSVHGAALRVLGLHVGLATGPKPGLDLLERSRRLFASLGRARSEATTAFFSGDLLWLDGREAEADADMARSQARFEAAGDRLPGAQLGVLRAYRAACEGRLADALVLLEANEPSISNEDPGYLAYIAVIRGLAAYPEDHEAGIAGVRGAIDIADRTRATAYSGFHRMDLARCILPDDPARAATLASDAALLFVAKGYPWLAGQASDLASRAGRRGTQVRESP